MHLPDKRAGGLLALILTLTLVCLVAGQRVPPGINPRRYQVPEQVVPHQKQPPYQHQRQQQILTPGNIQQERSHIQEHLPVTIDTSQMSEPELQFHFFKMHDADNNNKLDGCELLKSLIHFHEESSQNESQVEQKKEEEKVLSDEELAALIDPILQMDDTSGDGYIDYLEFVKSQEKKQKLRIQEQQQKQKF